MPTERVLPMFPLGRVLLPGEPLPLRIFEPRYLAMMGDVAGGDGEFGVVLISHGWEVGGDDQRVHVGTVASVLHDIALGEDQRTVVGKGTSRLEVVEWLPDDPYPRARVLTLDDAAGDAPDAEAMARLGTKLRRVYALASELGANVAGQDLDLPEPADEALWAAAALLPLSELDRQRVVETRSIAERHAVLLTLADDVIEHLTLTLGVGG